MLRQTQFRSATHACCVSSPGGTHRASLFTPACVRSFYKVIKASLSLSLLHTREWVKRHWKWSGLSREPTCKPILETVASDLLHSRFHMSRREKMLKVYSLRNNRGSSTLANATVGSACPSRIAIMKPLTLLYRAINLNITTRVSHTFGLPDLSPGKRSWCNVNAGVFGRHRLPVEHRREEEIWVPTWRWTID